MPSFTAQQLIDRAAAIADMHDSFVPAATWLDWATVELASLFMAAARSGWVVGPITPTTISPTDTYTMAAEFFALLGVWERDSGGRLRRLRVGTYVETLHQTAGGPIQGAATEVSLVDNGDGTVTFSFYPRPTQNSYLIVTINPPTRMTAVTDTVTLPAGLEERVVLGMARRALVKEESDTRAVDRLIQDEDRRVEEFAASRMFANAPRVRNTDYVDRGWSLNLVLPPPTMWIWL